MMISSMNSYSNYSFNLNTESKMEMSEYMPDESMSFDFDEEASTNSSIQSSTSLEDIQGSMRTQGPNSGPPPPPPPPADEGDELISSLIDSDEDDLWSTEELTAFSESLIDSMETSFDVEEIMEEYDTDNDGNIDASERTAMKEDNAFNLTPPKQEEELNEDLFTENSNMSNFVTQAMQAYDFSINIRDSFPENLFDSKVV